MSVDDVTSLNGRTKMDDGTNLSVPAALEFDASRYSAHVESFDISEAQKLELLQTLWSIMRTFVELGFEGDICAQLFEDFQAASDPASDDVKSLKLTTKAETQSSDEGERTR